MARIPKVKLPRVALQRSTLQTPNTPKFVKPKDGKRYIRMLGVFLTLLDKWGRPQPDKPSIHSTSTGRPLVTMALPWQLVLKRSGEPKPAKSARKDTSTPFERTLPCCLTSPLAVYAKTFSSSSIRDRFSKSAFRPKDQHACSGRQRLSLATALHLPDRTRATVLLGFSPSRNRFPSTVLVIPKDYQRPSRGCSKQILGDLTLRIRTERVRSTIARTCKFRFYIENKAQMLFDFRSPLPYRYPAPGRSFLHEFFSCF